MPIGVIDLYGAGHRWHVVTSALCMAPNIGVGEEPLACVGCYYSSGFDPALEPDGELIRAVYAELPPIWQGLCINNQKCQIDKWAVQAKTVNYSPFGAAQSTPGLAGDIAV
eukprot:scaffold90505_cov32-Prasinocladus_malaysianus.AAC.1